MAQAIVSVPEFFAHAFAIERDAAQRYAEMEVWMRQRGAFACAELCEVLKRAEGDHLAQLHELAAEATVAELPPGAYKWIGAGSPEAIPRDRFVAARTVKDILELALHSECEASRFFDHVARTSPDSNVQMLARQMAEEEAEHARWIEHALESPEALLRTPARHP